MPAIHSILVPSDLSQEAGHALEHAALFADTFGASLRLYHSVAMPDHAYAHWAFSHNAEIWSALEREARVALLESAARLGHQATAAVERTSSVPRALLAFIRNTRPDLVVMATHGRSGVEHLLLGSVTEKVFRNCHRSVLCVRRTAHESSLPYRRILVPTDFSPTSRLAFPSVAALARAFHAEVLAVHVRHTSAATLAGIPGDVLVPTEASLWEFCRRDFEGVAVTARIHSGSVWDRIVHAGGVEGADLIVMATHGHDSLMDRVIGSNTERVVRHAQCPCWWCERPTLTRSPGSPARRIYAALHPRRISCVTPLPKPT